ncbi:hypothetical protein FQA39_LY03365 [Lamprigera yunnana]|nr:hypothetical protein FQA39_LY03365 [Lamprigera yunnana]
MWIILAFYCLFLISGYDATEEKHIRIPIHRQKTPREQLLQMPNLKHYGIDSQWSLKPHKHNSTNDSIALFRYLDSEFYGEVQIGQKAQNFKMAFDTAWETSWVMSSECGWSTIGCISHNKYDHTKSFTYRPNGTKFSSYDLKGYFSNDTFLLGHTRVDGQLFVEMVEVPAEMSVSKADGVIGLGFKTKSVVPIFYNMLRNKSISKPLFSIYLNRDRQSNRGGNVLLGLIDKKHIHHKIDPESNRTVPEEITYLSVDPSQAFWKFRMDRVIFNGYDNNNTYKFCTSGCNAIPDTSTNLITGPSTDIKQINKLIKASKTAFGRYRVNCDTVNKLPIIDFVLLGKNFTLKGPQYTQKLSAGFITMCLSSFVSSDLESEQDMWILGGAFLSHFYSIYNLEAKTIGFVTAA